jgi:hypothetical protein
MQEAPEGQEEEEGPQKTPRAAWAGSLITQSDIDRLRRSRRIPDGVETRVPPEGEIQPNAQEGEYVVFAAHFDRGFALPLSPFATRFFRDYQLQPHHLPPNAITTLSAYVTFCEAYVGIRPLLLFWAKYFKFSKQVVKDPSDPSHKIPAQCGSSPVTPRKKSIFPRIKGLDSCKGWLQSWFYVKNRDPEVNCIGLPNPFRIGPPDACPAREYCPPDSEEDVGEFHKILKQLLAEGMTGDDLLRTFIQRRINPLQDRTHKMCVMSGAGDPNRMSTFELTSGEVFLRVKAIAQTQMTDGNWRWGKKPHDRHNQAPHVSVRTNAPNHQADENVYMF